MSVDARHVIYPGDLPRDREAEAQAEARHRRTDIAALLVERDNFLAQREAPLARPREGMIVVDARGNDTGLRVQNISAAMHREQVEADLRKLDDALAVVDRELGARGYEPSRD